MTGQVNATLGSLRLWGLTGGLAAGKTTAANFFSAWGAKVVDADEISHAVTQPGAPGWLAIQETFGRHFFCDDDRLDREMLGKHVFAHPEERKLLEALLHPIIRAESESKLAEIRKAFPEAVLIYSAPLLFEVGLEKMMLGVVAVLAKEATQIERLRLRNGFSEAEARRRIPSTNAAREKKALSRWAIQNDASLENFEVELRRVWMELRGADENERNRAS